MIIADRQGGYGNIVEIGHGNGIATRFGHLSEISVKRGQIRSYWRDHWQDWIDWSFDWSALADETRVNSDAVDPQKFLRAGLTLDDN